MIVNDNSRLQHVAQYKKIATWHILEKIRKIYIFVLIGR